MADKKSVIFKGATGREDGFVTIEGTKFRKNVATQTSAELADKLLKGDDYKRFRFEAATDEQTEAAKADAAQAAKTGTSGVAR